LRVNSWYYFFIAINVNIISVRKKVFSVDKSWTLAARQRLAGHLLMLWLAAKVNILNNNLHL
jgi:hypothetical protein